MPARLRNFIIERDSDFYRRLTVTDSDGVAVDLSQAGYAATLYVEAERDSSSALASFTAGASELALGNGYLDIQVPKATLAALDLSSLTREGSLNEPAPNEEPDYVGYGRLAYYRLMLTGPGDYDDTCLLHGQLCFANR